MVKCIDCANWDLIPECEHRPNPMQNYRCIPDMRDMSMNDMKAEQDCSRFKPKLEE